jgi:hypothetical protein
MVQKSGNNPEPDYSDDGQKGTRFLSTKAVSLLNKWFAENREYPYPDEITTDLLAREAGKHSIKLQAYPEKKIINIFMKNLVKFHE